MQREEGGRKDELLLRIFAILRSPLHCRHYYTTQGACTSPGCAAEALDEEEGRKEGRAGPLASVVYFLSATRRAASGELRHPRPLFPLSLLSLAPVGPVPAGPVGILRVHLRLRAYYRCGSERLCELLRSLS